MTNLTLNRRAVLCAIGAAGLGLSMPALAGTGPLMQVVKDPNCGCCGAWVDVINEAGFETEVSEVPYEALVRLKQESGISEEMASCHTARVEEYVIEGHVPPTDIRRLLSERPDAIGLSVPGMLWGTPGMGPESERDAYAVYIIRKDGTTEVFTAYDAA